MVQAEARATTTPGALTGIRVLDFTWVRAGPWCTRWLGALGAEVIKVESPAGDYIRQMTWPIIGDVSLMHYHINRGKKSVTLNLKQQDAIAIYKDLVKDADVVVEAMRPGALARLGLGFDEPRKINPKIVFCNISGYGMTGPYRNMPSHGIAYDTWAGIVKPAYDEDGFCFIDEHVSLGINAGPLVGALGILAAVLRARDSGEGSMLELAQSDCAAFFDWYRSESHLAYARPEDVVTGNKSDGYVRRAVGTAGMKEGVRYQMYESSDGHVLFMASEQAFWKNFCTGADRMDLFEKWPGSKFADHARNNIELQTELRYIFKTRSVKEWLAFASVHNTTIAPFNTQSSIADDPQFQDRMGFLPIEAVGCEQLPLPVFVNGERLPVPTMAPTVGEHTDEVLANVLGKTEADIARLRNEGVFGKVD